MTAKEVHAWLEKSGDTKTRDGMLRYGIVHPRAFGVPVGTMLKRAKAIGKDHALATELWKSDWYEGRMFATMVEDPAVVTKAQMERWAKAFDTWAICDTACWHVFDYTEHAWSLIPLWASSPREYVKRAAFVMMAGRVARHKDAPDAKFLPFLTLIEREAEDERVYVKKGINWALRRIGGRSPTLRKEATAVAKRLAASESPSARWIGKDALRELAKPASKARAAKGAKATKRTR